MKRKIIRQGHNTLTMTIPSEWAKRFNLSAGKEIDLIERENGLFITTEKTSEGKKTEFDITGMDIPTIWKYFMGVYREGYDEIKVKFSSDLSLENPYKFLTQHRIDLRYKKGREKGTILGALQGFVDRFIGLEIVEHGKDFILVREMGELTSKQFDNSLRRVFLLIQQMSEDTLEAIKKNNPKSLIDIHDVDVNLDKFHDYCIRILNKTSNIEPRKSEILVSILNILELVGDEFKNLSHHFLYDFSKFDFKNVIKITELIKEQLDAYYDLFYKFDKKKISKLSEIDSKIYMQVPEVYKKASEDEKEVFHHLRIIGRYLNCLLELRIEMEF
jgi:bifunctional DNA-binding transcriptional regulator/antitoxin component of YhaV-PrlF toxin-antitoxin module